MKKAYLTLVKDMLAKGYKISVFDEEGVLCKRTTSYKDIKENIESVEEAYIKIWNGGLHLGSATILPYEEPEETVVDMTANYFMNNWYEKRLSCCI